MKKMLKLTLLLSALFFFSPQAAMAQSYRPNPIEKLAGGIANVATGFMELPKTMIITSQREGFLYGVTVGLVAGVMQTAGRTAIGALDVATFMFPTDPWVEPHYIWEDFGTETTYSYRQTR